MFKVILLTKQLKKQFPEVADQYVKDLEHHIIYAHDEASSPAVKNYCEAVSLYPLLIDGTKGMDGLGTTAPKNLSSFCGQLVNLTFLLSAQCKGAVAFGEFFNKHKLFEDRPEHGHDHDGQHARIRQGPVQTVPAVAGVHYALGQVDLIFRRQRVRVVRRDVEVVVLRVFPLRGRWRVSAG